MMFDLSFSESLLILAVALVVLGPERLPKVARTAGVLLGRVRGFVGRVKGEIAEQMQQEDLRTLHTSLKESAHSLKKELDSSADTLNQTLHTAQNHTVPPWERLPEARTPEDFVHEKTPPPGKSLARQSRQRRRPARNTAPRPRKHLR